MAELAHHAQSPNIRKANKTVVDYLERKQRDLTIEQREAGNELKHRLRRLESDCNRLIKINNYLMDSEMPRVHFDESTDTMTYTFKGMSQSIKFRRADPNVPVKLGGSTAISAYVAGAKSTDSSNTEELKMLMEQMLEHYYDNAFRVTKLAQLVSGKKKYHCEAITIVRNKLIQHPEVGSIYSFGFGANGPVVKPIHRGKKVWNDHGLVPNTTALIDSLTDLFTV